MTAWSLTSPPVASNGHLIINSGFTGNKPCDDSVDVATGAPLRAALSLTNGASDLGSGQSEVIKFTVSVTLDSATKRTELDHKVWLVAYDTNDLQVVSATSGLLPLVLLVDPQGIVYDSITRQPVVGATVQLKRESCQSGVATAITAAEILNGSSGVFSYNAANKSVSMVTGADGQYQFFWLSPPVLDLCTYSITVTPPTGTVYIPSVLIPAQSGVYSGCGSVVSNSTAPVSGDATTHYGQVVAGYKAATSSAPASACEVLHNHIPLDPGLQPTNALFLEMSANKKELEIGDFIDYKLTLTNRTGVALTGVSFTNSLPPGFSYVPGTTFFEGVRTSDPSGGVGPVLTLSRPAQALANGASVTLQFRAKVGAGASTTVASINSATATSTSITSNVATWSAKIQGGVFADDAYAFGKVWLDCNRNGEQDGEDEPGVPGVRLFLENGTSVITDGQGRWSLYGLKPITHVLKLESRSLPAGAQLQAWDHRNAGSADSRFVDVKKGEFAKANFPIVNCEAPGLMDAVKARRDGAKVGTELEVAAKTRLTPSMAATPTAAPTGPGVTTSGNQNVTPASSPLIALPAAISGNNLGALGATGAMAPNPSRSAIPLSTSASISAGLLDPLPVITPVELETLLPKLDNQAGFVEFKDGDTLPSSTVNVRVKGPRGTILRLNVNGNDINDRRVGKKTELGSTRAAAWEYIGVTLQPGSNRLELKVIDLMGIARGGAVINVIAPDTLGQLQIGTATDQVYADPLTPFDFIVRLTDAAGVPVTARTAVTLSASSGSFADADLNPTEPGTQVFIEGGVGRFKFTPPEEPGPVQMRASSNLIVQEKTITLLPHLKPMSGIGIIEGVFSSKGRSGVPTGADGHASAFEAELTGLSREGNAGTVSARTAFYFKGAVKGEYLLTAAYDSDKTTKDRLFRDIRPEEYYPVYGDDSVRGFDAQSIGKLYVRIDNGRSYLLYGDFTSNSSAEVRRLSQVNRSLNGIKQHYETDNARVTSYASNTSNKQQVEELRANGLSFYYLTGTGDIVPNSEQVQLIVRSRSQPQVILSSRTLVRNTDYTLEPLTGRLMLVTPLSSVDSDLNPQSLRVSYDVDQGGPKYLTAGVDAQVKLGERVQVGVIASKDENPENNRRALQAVTAMGRIGESTLVAAELVRTESDLAGTGEGRRVELRHANGNFKVDAEVAKADTAFENPGSTLSAGRTEGTARAEWAINESTRLRGEVLYSKSEGTLSGGSGTDSVRSTSIALQKKLSDSMALEVGVRDGNGTGTKAGTFDYGAVPSTQTGTTTTTSTTSKAVSDAVDATTARARLTVRPSFLPSAEVFGEAEVDVHDSERRALAVGGTYALSTATRLYGRREFNSSLYETVSNGSSGTATERPTTVFGIDSAYMQGGRVFNEYRVGSQGVSNGVGLRNSFALSPAFRVNGYRCARHRSAQAGQRATPAMCRRSARSHWGVNSPSILIGRLPRA